MLAILPAILWIFFGAMLVMQEMDSIKEDSDKHSSRFYNYWRVAEALIKLWSAFLTFLHIFVSLCFRNWEFRYILTRRRRAKLLSELISALENDRSRAIRLCAKLKNVSTILSGHNSCAFTQRGEGEFEIDADITVRNLQDLQDESTVDNCWNYIFGAKYYGEPVMADAKRNVRKIEYLSEGQSTCYPCSRKPRIRSEVHYGAACKEFTCRLQPEKAIVIRKQNRN